MAKTTIATAKRMKTSPLSANPAPKGKGSAKPQGRSSAHSTAQTQSAMLKHLHHKQKYVIKKTTTVTAKSTKVVNVQIATHALASPVVDAPRQETASRAKASAKLVHKPVKTAHGGFAPGW